MVYLQHHYSVLGVHPTGTQERIYIRRTIDIIGNKKIDMYEFMGGCGEQFSVPKHPQERRGAIRIPKGKSIDQLIENDIFLIANGSGIEQWKFLELKKVA